MMTPRPDAAAPGVSALLGPLEMRVVRALWAAGAPMAVRDLHPAFPAIAYTTLMTTLDRLYRKGLLDRTLDGRAYRYRPRLSEGEFRSARAAEAVRAALEGGGAALGPVLSCLVETVGERDRALLDELEALVRARRAELERDPS